MLRAERFGAGRKAELMLLARMAVSSEQNGDLRVGLPLEMVSQHEPMRLFVIVEGEPQRVDRMLNAHPRVKRFFAQGFMHLACFHEGQLVDWSAGKLAGR